MTFFSVIKQPFVVDSKTNTPTGWDYAFYIDQKFSSPDRSTIHIPLGRSSNESELETINKETIQYLRRSIEDSKLRRQLDLFDKLSKFLEKEVTPYIVRDGINKDPIKFFFQKPDNQKEDNQKKDKKKDDKSNFGAWKASDNIDKVVNFYMNVMGGLFPERRVSQNQGVVYNLFIDDQLENHELVWQIFLPELELDKMNIPKTKIKIKKDGRHLCQCSLKLLPKANEDIAGRFYLERQMVQDKDENLVIKSQPLTPMVYRRIIDPVSLEPQIENGVLYFRWKLTSSEVLSDDD